MNKHNHFLGNSSYPEDRRRILISQSAHRTTLVVNYMADNNLLNEFLSVFDIFDGYGDHQISDDNNHAEVHFEMSEEFFTIASTEIMQRALSKFGVKIEFESRVDHE